MEENKILNVECMSYMKSMPSNSVDTTLTDIPYNSVCRATNGLSQLSILDNLEVEDTATFDEIDFCKEIYRITKNNVIIFCSREQFSTIFNFFASQKGTTRALVWEKTNPVPSNGQYVYLSGIEFAVWFKKKGSKVFNANCKNTVFRYPIPGGKRRIHKTQKHWDLWKELMLDNSNEGDIIFDPCAGSCVTAQVAIENNRKFLCCEMNKEIYDIALDYLKKNYRYTE